jgi:hypothetical protein
MTTRTTPTCKTCGVSIEAHWEIFLHAPVCQVHRELQSELRAMSARSQHRVVDWKLRPAGVTVTRGGD